MLCGSYFWRLTQWYLHEIAITSGVLGTQGVSVFELNGCDDCDWHHQESEAREGRGTGLEI
jgi:hypothetical protein